MLNTYLPESFDVFTYSVHVHTFQLLVVPTSLPESFCASHGLHIYIQSNSRQYFYALILHLHSSLCILYVMCVYTSFLV